MAKQSIYSKQLKELRKVSSSVPSASNKMGKQIQNYQNRLSGIGQDPAEATDKRNFIEKALNLPEDQNFLFDALEIINRPQQGLFGAIQNLQEGGDAWEGFKSGISGEEDYYAGDILRNMGVDDTPLFTGPLSGEDRSLADILGLAGDIFVDPVDVPLFALKPVKDAGKLAKGADVADDVLDATKYAYKFDPIAALGQKESKSLLEAGIGGLAKGTGKAVKGGTKAIVDASDLKTVKKLATENGLLKEGTKVTKEMLPSLVDDLGKMGVEVSLKSDALENAGKIINRSFNYKNSIPDNLYEKVNRSNNLLDLSEAYGKGINAENLDAITKYAAKSGKSADEVNELAQLYITSKYTGEAGVDELVRATLKNRKGNKVTSDLIRGSKEDISNLKKAVEEFVEGTPNVTDDALKVVITKGGAKLEGKANLLGAIHNNPEMMDALSKIRYTRSLDVDESIAKQIAKVDDLYSKDKEFKDLVDNLAGSYGKQSTHLSGVTDNVVNYSPITNRKGYADVGFTDEGEKALKTLKDEGLNIGDKFGETDIIGEGSKASFKGRTQSPIAQQRQLDFEKSLAGVKEKTQGELKELKKLRDNFIPTKKANLKEKLDKLNLKEVNLQENFKKNIDKLSLSAKKQAGYVDKYHKEFDSLEKLIDDEVIKKAPKVSNPKLVENLSKSTDNYVSKVQKLDDIKLQLAQSNLTKSKIEALQKQFDKAYDNVIKAKANVIEKNAKLKGAVEESFIKEAGKLADKMVDKSAKVQNKLTKAQIRTEKALDKIENTRKSYSDISLALKKQQENLKLQIAEVERLAKNPNEVAKQIKYLSGQIAQKERVLSVIDSVEGTKLYSTLFTEGFDHFIQKTTREAKSMKNYNEVLLQSALKNDDIAKFVKTGEKFTPGPNMVEVDPKVAKDFSSYLDHMQGLMPENSDLIRQFKNELENSKALYMDKDALGMITFKATKDDANYFVKTIDSINNLFKKTSTVSPGTQIRNAFGNGFNMWASGVPAKDMAGAYAKSIRLSKSDYIVDLVRKNANGTLSAAEKADWNVIKQFVQSGAMGKGKNIRDLGELIEKAATDKESAKGLKKAWDSIFEVSGKWNEKVDNISRMALLSYATENPKYVAKLGAKDAIDAMHKVLFDPQNLSEFERKYMKRLIPFYTFTKQNLMFQAKNILNNTTKYNRLAKTLNKTYEAVGEDNYRQYQKENMELPLFKNADGNLVSLKTNLPASDLGEYLENPLQRLVSSTSPLAKTPFEQVTGVDTFTGRDISDRSWAEALWNTTGLNNLTSKQIAKIYDFDKNQFKDTDDIFTASNLLPSVLRETDPEKVANQNQYEELMAYQEYVKNLKNQGIDVPTVKELTNSTSASIKNLKKMRDKINKRRSS